MTTSDDLTTQQARVLRIIREHVARYGYQPSIRDIATTMGLRSSGSVHFHLRNLEAKGYLTRAAPRAIDIKRDADMQLQQARVPVRAIPLVREVAIGEPIVAAERVEALYPLPKEIVGDGALFMLEVRDESMIGAGILAGDYVVVREQSLIENGELCVALVDGRVTVKYFQRTGPNAWALQAASDSFTDIVTDESSDVTILGKVVSMFRRLP